MLMDILWPSFNIFVPKYITRFNIVVYRMLCMGKGGNVRFKVSIGIAILTGILSALVVVIQSYNQKK